MACPSLFLLKEQPRFSTSNEVLVWVGFKRISICICSVPDLSNILTLLPQSFTPSQLTRALAVLNPSFGIIMGCLKFSNGRKEAIRKCPSGFSALLGPIYDRSRGQFQCQKSSADFIGLSGCGEEITVHFDKVAELMMYLFVLLCA